MIPGGSVARERGRCGAPRSPTPATPDIGQGQIRFQSRRPDLFQFPDHPPRVVQARPQLPVQSRAPQMGRQPLPQIGLLRGQPPPRAPPALIRDQVTVGVDQGPVQLAPPVVGLFAQLGADHVMQHQPDHRSRPLTTRPAQSSNSGQAGSIPVARSTTVHRSLPLLEQAQRPQDTSAHGAPGRSSSNLRSCSAVARTSRSQRCA